MNPDISPPPDTPAHPMVSPYPIQIQIQSRPEFIQIADPPKKTKKKRAQDITGINIINASKPQQNHTSINSSKSTSSPLSSPLAPWNPSALLSV